MTHPPLFTLAPWELPPDCNAPLSAPADYVFRSLWQYGFTSRARETEIHLRIVPYKDAFLNYFCDGERPQNGNWVLSYTTHYSYCERVSDFDKLDSLFREDDDLWFASVQRLLYIEGTPYNSPGCHRFTISPSNGECQIQYGTQTVETEYDSPAVRIPSPFRTYRAPRRAVTTRNQLLAALEDQNSLARHALSALHTEPHIRSQQEQEFKRKKLAPMKKLLTSVLQAQTDVWQLGQSLFWQTCELGLKKPAYHSPGGWDGNSLTATTAHTDIPVTPVLQRWKTAIWNTYIASPRDRWLLYSALGRSDISMVDVTVKPPTAHERMEAVMLLRDWYHKTFATLYFDTEGNSL